MECDQCFPSQPFVVLTFDQFVGHRGDPLERRKQDKIRFYCFSFNILYIRFLVFGAFVYLFIRYSDIAVPKQLGLSNYGSNY